MRIPHAQYVVPAALAFIFGLVAWQIESDHLGLEYEIVESAPFPREAGTGKYFIIRIQNVGNKPLDHTEFKIKFDAEAIESSRFGEPSLVTSVSQSASSVAGSIPLSNPDESVSVTITTFGQTEARTPTVSTRAPGVTGKLKTEGSTFKELFPFVVILVAVLIFLLTSTVLWAHRTANVSESISKIENLGEVSVRLEKSEEDFAARMAKLKESEEKRRKDMEESLKAAEERELRVNQGEPGTEQIIFSIINRAGLAHKFFELAVGGEGITYRQTGIFLVHCYLTDAPNRDKYLAAMEALASETKVSASSKGFNLYLLGKMEQARGNSQAAIKWLERCRQEAPLMYEHLMSQDPAFDLAAIASRFGVAI